MLSERNLIQPSALITLHFCCYLYGINLRIFLVSTADTSVPWRRCRLRFLPLLESRWLLNPLFLLIFPLPVTLNLFAAARLVLIFGTFISSYVIVVKYDWVYLRQERFLGVASE